MAPPDPASGSSLGGEFAPGEVLIGRYRIVTLVGEGGMGQVYLADDLVLGQAVAVKFLPSHLAERDGGLERFRAEVRHAREVTHPNVARVHDIGEVDGRHFLTMEFVDGEDLASLVKRIGRVPGEKAAEIAQQVCAGLAEAHRRGVLHRDLKPANVMLDGEGRVKLTDFGLAVAAESGTDGTLAGTPRYMAPEQLAGLPATVRSEIYSLGLVLYELYTGKRALRGRTLEELRREHEEGPVQSASSVLAGIDPGVEAVLARCLMRDPAERPGSVREVARALPGGDPLAAALAAGETPSPEVVAAARTRGALAPRVALTLLVAFAALAAGLIVARTELRERIGVVAGKAPAVLDERAREAFAELAGHAPPPHEARWYGFAPALSELREDPDAHGRSPLSHLQPLVRIVRFSQQSMVPRKEFVASDDPAPRPGDAQVVLDAQGHLIGWWHRGERPGENDGSASPATAAVPDSAWTALLARTGIDPAALRSVEPRELPLFYATERRAWEPMDAAAEDAPLRIEAAGLDGRPVELAILRDGEPLAGLPWRTDGPGVSMWVMLAVLVLASLLAWRNVRARRAHVPGALAVGAFALATHVILVFAGAVADGFAGFGSALYEVTSGSLHVAVRVTVLYLALEPFARRRWPNTLIAWSRLLEGRVRDPSVGREVLIGLFASQVALTLFTLIAVALHAAGLSGGAAQFGSLGIGIDGPMQVLSAFGHLAGDVVMYAGIGVFLLIVARSVMRIAWLGNAVWIALMLTVSGGLDAEPSAIAIGVLMPVCILVLLSRLGFLAVVAFMLGVLAMMSMPLTLQTGDWYFTQSAIALALLGGLAVAAYRVATAGRSAFE